MCVCVCVCVYVCLGVLAYVCVKRASHPFLVSLSHVVSFVVKGLSGKDKSLPINFAKD